MTAIDLDRPYALHPQVAVRAEPFGALLYHFGTRRLSFLTDRRLLAVVEALGSQPTARAACAAAGVSDVRPAPVPAGAGDAGGHQTCSCAAGGAAP